MNPGPILLTGAGGDIGIALARILREAWPDTPLIGADCDAEAVGAEFVDRFHILPRADDPDYIAALRHLAERERAAALVPLAEAELARLLADGLIRDHLGDAALVTANRRALATGLDKLATARALSAVGIAVPETGIVGEDEPGDFDLIVKPRCGQGSKGLRAVSRAGFEALRGECTGELWQRWLKDAGEEYTCGIVRFDGVPTRSLSFRRTLQGGLTGKGMVVHDLRLTRICAAVADALKLDGAINVQLRIDAGEPTIFEVNPRLSSTVGFRHRLGFCDAVWAIKDRLGLPVSGYVAPDAGVRIERVGVEVIRSLVA
ncbi:MAG: ATP-grasp domain-containing protein [Erythrobacter sp.]